VDDDAGRRPRGFTRLHGGGSYNVSLWMTDKDGRTGQAAAITVTVGP